MFNKTLLKDSFSFMIRSFLSNFNLKTLRNSSKTNLPRKFFWLRICFLTKDSTNWFQMKNKLMTFTIQRWKEQSKIPRLLKNSTISAFLSRSTSNTWLKYLIKTICLDYRKSLWKISVYFSKTEWPPDYPSSPTTEWPEMCLFILRIW